MAKKQEEKISIFGQAKVKTSGTKPKDDKEVIYIDGLEPKLLELEFLKAQIKDLEAQLGGVADEIKNISKEKFVELYKSNKSNPNTFLIKDGEGCVMVIPTDRYISIKDEDRANQLIEEYGDDIISVDEKYYFNTQVLERNMSAIEKLIMDAKTISNEDKKNLLVKEVKYSISKGYIDKLAQYGSKIETVLDDIQPVITLKNCGGKMEEGGMMGDDFIGNVYEHGSVVGDNDDTELYYTKDYFEYADWSGDGDNDGYIYGINLLDDNGDVMDAEWFKSDSERRNYILENNLFEYKFEGGGFLGGIFGGGRTYKKGLAYKLDRAKHNKSEDWEVPINKRKYEGGGGVDWYDFDKKMALINLNQINEYAIKLDNIVTEDTELEEWVKMKLTRVEQNVADVKKSLEGWEKFEEFGDGGRIFKKQLLHIAKYSKDLIAMIKLGSKLMSWQESKLAISAEYIDAVYHHLDYEMGNRASKFGGGGGVDKRGGEIPKIQLENMIGKKLDDWNDDIVYYNGKKYQKCYLRPYYKVC